MKALLVYPPITDPTSGYHSLCYLETYARKHGFEQIDIIDVNIESLLYTMRPDQFAKIKSHCAKRRAQLLAQPELNGLEQLELNLLWRSEGIEEMHVHNAIHIMRDQDRFFDYRQYRYAGEVLHRWLNILSLLAYPGQFPGFTLPVRHMFNLLSTSDMADHEVCDRIAAPFLDYVQNELIAQIVKEGYRVLGVNITYCAQLPFALSIARIVRKHCPEIKILFGGTEVADVWKYLNQKSDFFDIFDVADACVVGEGEQAFLTLLRGVETGFAFDAPIPNVLFHPKYGFGVGEPEIQYFPIVDLPTPDYQKLSWEKYLAPYSYVYYSPSRGCYWNKCTFCDYGLNFESPTSPWRQNPVDKIYEDLQAIAAQGHKYIYFSVDVLAPSLLLKLSEKIVSIPEAERLDIRWGAEIRLETYWSPERCQTLKQAGCTDISVGYESGNQRILDLINKGTKVEQIKETMQNFADAGIGVQMMGFTGFPTETFEDAMQSVDFLKNSRSNWTFGGLGEFTLTPGAIVAKEPERFQVEDVSANQNETIVRSLSFTVAGNSLSADETTKLENAKRGLSASDFNRPFVGGVDTGHTMFYHDRYGTNILRALRPYENGLADESDAVWVLNGRIAEDFGEYPVDSLLSEKQLSEWHREALSEKNGLTASILQERMQKFTREASQHAGARRQYFIRTDGMAYPFPQEMLDFLASFAEGRTVQACLAGRQESDHDSIRKLIAHSIRHHFLREAFVDGRSAHHSSAMNGVVEGVLYHA
ncbi:B12-binding domain-containing radical SAM protein [Tumebacillus lipolyticus]|uniref:B12-binding domain-containing radical SAM protein n=1 Tax=Tumebacillus lipolyticus TaxID=1280370 RepID=A0ABW4ZTK8_9BACL